MKCSKCSKPSFISPCRDCLIEELKRLQGVGLLVAIILLALVRPMPQTPKLTPVAITRYAPASLDEALDISLHYGLQTVDWTVV